MQYCWMTTCQETCMGMIYWWHQTFKLMLFKTKSLVIGLFDQFLDSLRIAIIYHNWFFETWILLGSFIHPTITELSITPLLWPFTLHPNPHKKAIVWCIKDFVVPIPFCKTPMFGFPCMAGCNSLCIGGRLELHHVLCWVKAWQHNTTLADLGVWQGITPAKWCPGAKALPYT
jgi:hypothetical protein